MSKSTLEKLREIMVDVFDADDDLEISPTTTADDVEEWDSLSHIRLMVAIERAFNIRFKGSEIDDLKNIGELVAVIDAKVN